MEQFYQVTASKGENPSHGVVPNQGRLSHINGAASKLYSYYGVLENYAGKEPIAKSTIKLTDITSLIGTEHDRIYIDENSTVSLTKIPVKGGYVYAYFSSIAKLTPENISHTQQTTHYVATDKDLLCHIPNMALSYFNEHFQNGSIIIDENIVGNSFFLNTLRNSELPFVVYTNFREKLVIDDEVVISGDIPKESAICYSNDLQSEYSFDVMNSMCTTRNGDRIMTNRRVIEKQLQERYHNIEPLNRALLDLGYTEYYIDEYHKLMSNIEEEVYRR